MSLARGDLKTMKSSFEEMRSEMRGEISKMNNKLDTVVDSVKNELKAEISVLSKTVETALIKIDNCEKVISEVKLRVSMQDQIIERYEDKIIDLDARGRRKNLIFHGVPEKDGEDTTALAKKIIKEHMKIDDEIKLQRAHRSGPKRQGSHRILIMLFLDYQDRERVRMCKKMLPDHMHLTEDMSLEVRTARRELQPDVNAAYAAGHRVHIAWPARLIVNNVEVKRVRPKFNKFTPQAPRGHTSRGDAPSDGRSLRFGDGLPLPPGVRGMKTGEVAGVGPGSQQSAVGDGAAQQGRGALQTQSAPSVSSGGGSVPAKVLPAASGSSGGGSVPAQVVPAASLSSGGGSVPAQVLPAASGSSGGAQSALVDGGARP